VKADRCIGYLAVAAEVGDDFHHLRLGAVTGYEGTLEPVVVAEPGAVAVRRCGLFGVDIADIHGIHHEIVGAAGPEHAHADALPNLTLSAEIPECLDDISLEVGGMVLLRIGRIDHNLARHCRLHEDVLARVFVLAPAEDANELPFGDAVGAVPPADQSGLDRPHLTPVLVGFGVFEYRGRGGTEQLLGLIGCELLLALLGHRLILVFEAPGGYLRPFGVLTPLEHQAVAFPGIPRRHLLENDFLVPIQDDLAAATVVEEEIVALRVHQETEQLPLARIEELHTADFSHIILH
jgi:hypothetical protein